MEKLKNLKYGMGILAYVLLIGLFFAIGYYTGNIHGASVQKKIYETEDEAISTSSYASVYEGGENTADKSPGDTVYEVSLDGGMLVIIKHHNGDTASIAQCAIAENVYPKADIERLKKGIKFDDIKDALSVFEDFVS